MDVIQVAQSEIRPGMCGSVKKISAYNFAYEAPKSKTSEAIEKCACAYDFSKEEHKVVLTH